MASNMPTFDLCREIRRVGESFESALATEGHGTGRSTPGAVDRGATPRNISLALPYHLISAFPFDRDLDAARAMSRGNAFGAAHFLAQDRLLDGDDTPSPRRCGFSDLCLVRFVREYAALFDRASRFWELFEGYLREYERSLTWERDVLWSEGGAACVRDADSLEITLVMLGRKMAPLKSTVAAVSLLSGDSQLLADGERLIVAYHAGYQLSDDLRDLDGDAGRGRWSVPLRLAASGQDPAVEFRGMSGAELLDVAVRSGAFETVTGLIRGRYEEAVNTALGLGLDSLAHHVREALRETVEASLWVTRRVSFASRASGPARMEGRAEKTSGVTAVEPTESGGLGSEEARPENAGGCGAPRFPHSFAVQGRRFVVDPLSCLLFEADGVATDVLAWMRSGSPGDALRVLRLDHGASAVDEALRELAAVSPDGSEPPGVAAGRLACATPTSIVSLALDVTSACNLACDYCYLRSSETCGSDMPPETALACLELLLDEASSEGVASLVFFGGEPLLRSDLVLDVAHRARREAAERGISLRMHLTTNGTLLSPDVAASLSDAGISVMVSIDGPADTHDRHRRFPDGGGSHDLVARNLVALPPGTTPSARVTLTEQSAPLCEIVSHLSGLGFTSVHLAPASGGAMSVAFSRRLLSEFEELACRELESIRAGGRPVVRNFARAMRALASGRPRARACGAGARYICASPDGTLYVCHRFAGDARFEVGTASAGVDRAAVARLLNTLRGESTECDRCWARFLCGGPCLHDLRVDVSGGVPDPMRCELSKRVYELAMWMYASLPPGGDARRTGTA